MNKHNNNFLVSDGELFDLARFLKLEKTRLAVLPRKGPPDQSTVEQEYGQLPVEDRDELAKIVQGLASPVRLLRLHYSIADETISRQLIIWPGASDEVVTLARNGSLWRAGRNTEFGIRSLIMETLGAGSNLRRDPFALQLSSSAVMVFMGIMEQMKYSRLYSILMSKAPVGLFAPADVLARMQESTKEDFRWPLAMFEKVFPVKMMEIIKIKDIIDGLNELVKLDLVEVCDDTGNVFELSPAGEMVADSLLHDVSKVAMCVSQCREDGVIGHDVALLVRSSFYLILFELSGEAGVIAALDAEEAEQFLKKTLEVPSTGMINAAKQMADTPVEPKTELVQETGAQPQKKPAAAGKPGKFCGKCGKPVQADALFCPNCGNPISQKQEAAAQKPVNADACPNCGKPIRPGAKFCRNCGKAL